MKKLYLVVLVAVAALLVVAGGFARADVAVLPSDSPTPSPDPTPSPAEPCGQLSQGYTHECPGGDPTPVPIGAPMDPPASGPPAQPVAGGPAPAPDPDPTPVAPTLKVTAMSWCSQCPTAAQMVVTVRDVTAGAVPVVGACGTVTVGWPDGSVETHQGCTGPGVGQPNLTVTLTRAWSTVSIKLRLDFSYKGGRVVSCTNTCP